MSSSLTVRRIAAGQGDTYRELRTASLREAPYAFGETLEEVLLADAATFEETAGSHAVSDVSTTFILYTEGHPAGLVCAFSEAVPPCRAFVCELWVAPAVRHLHGGELLVNTASAWLAEQGACEVHAWVADANRNARRFYERLGFTPAGERALMARVPQEWQTLLVRGARRENAAQG
jgi:ribosomal protein S18 acetylase RimI-like enzyme